MNHWYLWEKEPGRLGILPESRRNDHRDSYVASFEGTLEEAIRFAEDLERTGYSVLREESEPVKEMPAFMYALEDDPPVPEKEAPKEPKKEKSPRKTSSQGPKGIEGQMSLFDLISS